MPNLKIRELNLKIKLNLSHAVRQISIKYVLCIGELENPEENSITATIFSHLHFEYITA